MSSIAFAHKPVLHDLADRETVLMLMAGLRTLSFIVVSRFV